MSGLTFVISAPSGTGKTTVCGKLLAQDANLRFSVSHTTRLPRTGESDGDDYHFVDEDRFKKLVVEDAFLEYARYAENLYGTSFAAIQDSLADGFDILLEIEVQGAAKIRASNFEAIFIFLLPPSMKTLDQRLRDRGTDSDEVIRRRLREGNPEISMASMFDYAVINEDLGDAVAKVREIVEAERSGDAASARAKHGIKQVLAGWLAQEEKTVASHA